MLSLKPYRRSVAENGCMLLIEKADPLPLEKDRLFKIIILFEQSDVFFR